jgi:polyisoprenoid-binding protein YceI
MKRVLFTLACLLTPVSFTAQNGPCVIPGRGHFQIHVGTGGLFGAFAHNHVIEAQKIEGCVKLDAKDPTMSSLKLTFQASGIRVLDPSDSAKDRATVQQTMETEVLHTAEFPQITFESTGILRAAGANQYRVKGNLKIRDKTQPVEIPVTFSQNADGTYEVVGKYMLKQTSFGIKPIQLAGGTVKVKDEIQTEFDLFLK